MTVSERKDAMLRNSKEEFSRVRALLNELPMSRHVAISLTDLEKLEVFVRYTIMETVFPDQA